MRKAVLLPFMLFSLLIAAGCAGVVPPELAKEVAPNLNLTQVRENPDQYKGKTVLWGGRIIRSVNKKEGTLVEVLQQDLDTNERPKETDETQGRFIVSMKGYLETALYHYNREVTVVGEVAEVKSLPLGEIQYNYVLLRGKELKLWPKRPVEVRMPQDGPWIMYVPGPGPYPYWFHRPYLWW